MNILTLNEEMLLTVIFHLEDNAYGVTIMAKIREISPKKIVFGTLYWIIWLKKAMSSRLLENRLRNEVEGERSTTP